MNTHTRRAGRWTLALTALALGACADREMSTEPQMMPPQFAVGDVYTVTNTNDAGIGSLRWALGYVTGGEIIRFDPSLAGATIALASPLSMLDPFTLEGPADKGIVISGGGQVRVFELNHPGVTTLRNITVRDGQAPVHTSGGGIYSTGDLVLEHATVMGNKADGASGIIASNLKLINSTISGNTSSTGISAVLANARFEVINTTVANNPTGGISPGGVLTLRNSLIANNGPINCKLGSTTVTYEGANLSNDDSCGGPTDVVIADPMLIALADNGGPGMTHALPAGSPALNTGTSCSVQVDQRHVARDAMCDLGAFEFIDPTTIALGIDASVAVNRTTGWTVITGSVQCSRDEAFDLVVEIEQMGKGGKRTVVVKGTGSTAVACGTSPRPWSVALAPTNAVFENGDAQVSVRTENTPGWATPAAASRSVKLFWAKK